MDFDDPDVFDEFDPEEFNPDIEMLEKIKWVCDGATTLSEAASQLREYADYLLELEQDGWQLNRPAEDSYLHMFNYSILDKLGVQIERIV